MIKRIFSVLVAVLLVLTAPLMTADAESAPDGSELRAQEENADDFSPEGEVTNTPKNAAADYADGGFDSDGSPQTVPDIVQIPKEFYFDQLTPLGQAVYRAVQESNLGEGPHDRESFAIDLAQTLSVEDRTSTDGDLRIEIRRDASTVRQYVIDSEFHETIRAAMYALMLDHPELSWLTHDPMDWFSYDILRMEHDADMSLEDNSSAALNVGESKYFPCSYITYDELAFWMNAEGYHRVQLNSGEETGQEDSDPVENLAAMEAEVQKAISDIGNLSSMNTYEKAHTIYVWIQENIEPVMSDPVETDRVYKTSYGALAERKASFSGYAAIMKVLCDEYDVPCIIVNGYAGGRMHAWNVLNLDGHWYGTDAAWEKWNELPAQGEDASEDENEALDQNYQYFLKGRESFMVLPENSDDKWRHSLDAPGLPTTYKFTYPALALNDFDPEGETYSLIIQDYEHMTVTVPSLTYAEGEEVWILVQPDRGYGISGRAIWRADNDSPVTVDEQEGTSHSWIFTFSMPPCNVFVKLAAEERYFPLTYSCEGGEAEVAIESVGDPGEGSKDTPVRVCVEPQEHYRVKQVVVNETIEAQFQRENEYLFYMPEEAANIVVELVRLDPAPKLKLETSPAYCSLPFTVSVEDSEPDDEYTWEGTIGDMTFGPSDGVAASGSKATFNISSDTPEPDTVVTATKGMWVDGWWIVTSEPGSINIPLEVVTPPQTMRIEQKAATEDAPNGFLVISVDSHAEDWPAAFAEDMELRVEVNDTRLSGEDIFVYTIPDACGEWAKVNVRVYYGEHLIGRDDVICSIAGPNDFKAPKLLLSPENPCCGDEVTVTALRPASGTGAYGVDVPEDMYVTWKINGKEYVDTDELPEGVNRSRNGDGEETLVVGPSLNAWEIEAYYGNSICTDQIDWEPGLWEAPDVEVPAEVAAGTEIRPVVEVPSTPAGSYLEYRWTLNGELISEGETCTPADVGTLELEITRMKAIDGAPAQISLPFVTAIQITEGRSEEPDVSEEMEVALEGPASAISGQSVTVHAVVSHLPEDDDLHYEWEAAPSIEGGTMEENFWTFTVPPVSSPQDYTLRVTVWCGDDSAAAAMTITIRPAQSQPTASAGSRPGPGNGGQGSGNENPGAAGSGSGSTRPTASPTARPTYVPPVYNPPASSETDSAGTSGSGASGTPAPPSSTAGASTSPSPSAGPSTVPPASSVISANTNASTLGHFAPVQIVANPNADSSSSGAEASLILGVPITPNRVDAVTYGTAASRIMDWIAVPSGATVSMLDKDRNPVDPEIPMATGHILVVQDEHGNTTAEATIVVKGDVLGSGVMRINQLVRAAKALSGEQPLEGIYLEAGKLVPQTQNINVADIVQMAQILRNAT